MGGVDHEDGLDLVGYRPESLIVEGSGIGRVAGKHDLGLVLQRQGPDLVHVDRFGLGIHPVGHKVVIET
jgi:hypothetical protein